MSDHLPSLFLVSTKTSARFQLQSCYASCRQHLISIVVFTHLKVFQKGPCSVQTEAELIGVVEQRIQQSMREGGFDKLHGQGKVRSCLP
jgi:hypothetical protein